jgi:hypothetical protein
MCKSCGKPNCKGACKSKGKGLTAKQKKLDTNKNGKLEGSDFAALRAKKKK